MMTFFITLLDFECKIILGHNWLTHYNLLINWVTVMTLLSHDTCQTSKQGVKFTPPILKGTTVQRCRGSLLRYRTKWTKLGYQYSLEQLKYFLCTCNK